MRTPLRIGIVGCGRAAESLHLPGCLRISDVRVVAVADRIPERRERIAAAVPDCMSFESLTDLLEGAAPEAILIATPPEEHGENAADAMKAGLPVLVEKPLAPTLEAAEELVALQAHCGVPVAVGFNRRFWAPVADLRRHLAHWSGHGTVCADLVMTSDVGAWSAICAIGDPLDDLGCHQLDLLRYLFNREITSMRARRVSEAEIHMTVGLDGAVTATCIAAHGPVSRERVTMRGDGWAYEVHHGSQRITPLGGAVRSMLDFWDNASRRLRGGRSAMVRSYELQLRNFVRHVRDRTQPSPGITDGLESVRAVAAARLSAARNGQEVNLPSLQTRTDSHE